jgi:hypothetical protein
MLKSEVQNKNKRKFLKNRNLIFEIVKLRIEMLVIQLLLPRFLVVEVVFFFHFMQESQASFLVKSDSTKSDETKVEMEYVVPAGKCNPEDEFLFCNLRGLCSINFVTNLTNYIIIDSKAIAAISSSGNVSQDGKEILLGSKDKQLENNQNDKLLCEHSGPKISKTTTEYHKQDVDITLRYHASTKTEYNVGQKSVSTCYKRQIHQIFGPSEKSRFTVYKQIPNCKGSQFHHRLQMEDSYKTFSFGVATTTS